MTREEAIDILDEILRLNLGLEQKGHPAIEAMKVALSALTPPTQEQMERLWPGCDICREVPLRRIGINKKEIYVVDCRENLGTLKLCPYCGRPLTPAAWEELRKRWEALTDVKTD